MKFDFIPLEIVLSPLTKQVELETRKIVSKFDLDYDPELTQSACSVYPHHDLESLITANLIHIFLWILDDKHIDSPYLSLDEKFRAIRECLTTVESWRRNEQVDCSNSSVLSVVKLLDCVLRRDWDGDLRMYVLEQLTDYLLGNIQRLGIGTVRITSSTQDSIRSSDSGCKVVFPLLLLGQDTENIKSALRYLRSNQGKLVQDAANKNISYVNDIVSVKKDKADGCFNYNIVSCLMNDKMIGEEEAISRLKVQCNDLYRVVTTLNKCQYLEGLATWCVMSAKWHLIARRYNE